MIRQQQREAVLALYRTGKPKKRIARLLELDIKTVRRILSSGDAAAEFKDRSDKITLDEALLKSVYHRCDGYLQRVHEVLSEEHGINVGYSTLSQKVRQAGLGESKSSRSFHVDDVPGDEMQHDTSVYELKIGDKKVRVIGSGIYLRYSKMRYVRFYRRFNRFTMKCFFDEALRFLGYCARTCVIDNTSLSIWYGTGPRAVFIPEMVNFAKNYGFEWYAHEVGHSNRKAGKERNFWTVETNFFPGRGYVSLEDLNEQAFQWVTKRFAQRPQSKTGLIPIQTFEHEKPYLVKLPEYVPHPSRPHRRGLDEYGYAAFDANYYWVPEYTKDKQKIKMVDIIEYAKHIVLFHRTTELARYDLPKDGVRNQRFAPPGVSLRYQPKHRKKPSIEEEKALRGFGKTVCDYVDFIKSKESGIHYRHHFLRQLYHLCKKISAPLLEMSLERALKYRVNRIETLSRIAAQCMKPSTEYDSFPEIPLGHDYMEREAYQKGRFCEEPDLFKADDAETLNE